MGMAYLGNKKWVGERTDKVTPTPTVISDNTLTVLNESFKNLEQNVVSEPIIIEKEIIKEVEVIKEKIIEVPIEVIKEVKVIEERIVEIIKEVPVEIIKEVEVIREKLIEVPIDIIKEVKVIEEKIIKSVPIWALSTMVVESILILVLLIAKL